MRAFHMKLNLWYMRTMNALERHKTFLSSHPMAILRIKVLEESSRCL